MCILDVLEEFHHTILVLIINEREISMRERERMYEKNERVKKKKESERK